METRHARMVREIAETGRISLASERIGIGQPALSKIVQRIEDEFGVALFDRGPQGSSLTPFGRLFLEFAQVIERETNDLMATAQSMRKGESGHFRIGAGQTWIHDLMPTILHKVHAARPNLSFSVVTGSVPDLVDQLVAGQVDLAFVSMTIPLSEDIVAEELIRDRLRIVARRDHPLSLQDSRPTIEEMLEYSWIIGEAINTDLPYSWLIKTTTQLGLPKPKIALETHQKYLMVEMVKNSNLLAFEPGNSPAVRNGEIVVLSEQPLGKPRGTGMIWRKEKAIAPGLQFLMDTVRTISAENNPMGQHIASDDAVTEATL